MHTEARFKTVEELILAPESLEEKHLLQLLSHLTEKGVDEADLYCQARWFESYALENGIIRHGNFGIEKGVGIRATKADMSGFSFTEDLSMPALLDAVQSAKYLLQVDKVQTRPQRKMPAKQNTLYPAFNPIESLPEAEKINILQSIDSFARQADPCIKKVNASLSAQYEAILLLNHTGEFFVDLRPLVRINVQVLAERNGRRESGHYGVGGRENYTAFTSPAQLRAYAEEAVRLARVNLEAKPAPAGSMPVILGAGWPGVLLHEAVGHGLEGDFIRKKTSVFTNRLGERVATPLCTIIDNGTIPGKRGSLSIDDEGVSTQETVLIENGILKGFLFDKMNARLMGCASTGNGRRESYAHMPLPRMTNTYMLPGKHHLDEMIASIPRGIYAVNFDGGQVDITSGQFVFSTSEAYLIENGKITHPVKGASLIGAGHEILKEVSMVANDFSLDAGVGTCGKEGQSVPVGVGQPSLKIDNIVVGGAETT